MGIANMKVDIDQQLADQILTQSILYDIASLRRDIMRLELAGELPPYRQEDLNDNLKYVKALELAAEYYIGFHWEKQLEKDPVI
jgi:hypothetical protein